MSKIDCKIMTPDMGQLMQQDCFDLIGGQAADHSDWHQDDWFEITKEHGSIHAAGFGEKDDPADA